MNWKIFIVASLLIISLGGFFYSTPTGNEILFVIEEKLHLHDTEMPSSVGVPPSAGYLVEHTASSITIGVSNEKRETYTLNPQTAIISLAHNDEKGKTLDDIATGTPVLIIRSQLDQNTVDSVYISSPLSSNETDAKTIIGFISQFDEKSIVVTEPQGTTKNIQYTSSTTLTSLVKSGVKGKTFSDIAVGVRVVVTARLTDTDSLAAQVIHIQ